MEAVDRQVLYIRLFLVIDGMPMCVRNIVAPNDDI